MNFCEIRVDTNARIPHITCIYPLPDSPFFFRGYRSAVIAYGLCSVYAGAMTQRKLIFYVLATHGRRDVSKSHPAVRRQVNNLEAWHKQAGQSRHAEWTFDYARRIRCLDDLPRLSKRLARGEVVVMDDLGRLFRPCSDLIAARDLLEGLYPHVDRLVGLRQRSAFSGLTQKAALDLLLGAQDPRFVLTKNTRSSLPAVSRLSTEEANAASGRARKKAADEKALALAELRDRLIASGAAPSFSQLARHANEEGLRTTRGNEWRGDTVFRALKRLRTDDG
ncbi:hypothetical protein FIU91_07100 [Roseivivax sp. THAF30]|nr:hypothetical protein FIU91_07100 [Roseivivax sp. THAF30]